MKKILSFIMPLLIAFASYALPTQAKSPADVVVSLTIDNPMMTVNGIEAEIDEGRGTVPVVINDRTLVPIRAIIEAFGGEVFWDESTRSAEIALGKDSVKLSLNSNNAYINGSVRILDTAPAVVNDRTMLPLRFVAEGFNLGVAWEQDTKTVSVIRNIFEENEYNALMATLPPYSGQAYVEVYDNIPQFEDYEIVGGSFEYYSYLDDMGRCDVCMASVAEDIMPTEERGSISSVTPTGWQSVKYDVVSGKYLYNRCHLIGFQLTGENANKRNLITGTRYLNVDAMLPFENMVADYIEATGNHVMYRSTPVFSGDNLVADGVLLEGYSVEDNGEGISFCIYCYNVQPNIQIDYKTGNSSQTGAPISFEHYDTNQEISNTESTGGIYRTPSGKRYHFDKDCGGKNSYPVTLAEATSAGLTPCLKCAD